MKVKFRQKSAGWCTVLMWANVLNNEAVLKFMNDERFKGCSLQEEEELLREFMPELLIQPVLSMEQSYGALPKLLLWSIFQREDDVVIFDNQVIPYTLCVRLVPSMWHSVAVLKHSTGLYYLDPYRENWIKIEDFELFKRLFIDCNYIQRPKMKDGNSFASFDGDKFEYPFLEPQLA